MDDESRIAHYKGQRAIMRVAFTANYIFGIGMSLLAIDGFRSGEPWVWPSIQVLLALFNFAAAFNTLKILERIRDLLTDLERDRFIFK